MKRQQACLDMSCLSVALGYASLYLGSAPTSASFVNFDKVLASGGLLNDKVVGL